MGVGKNTDESFWAFRHIAALRRRRMYLCVVRVGVPFICAWVARLASGVRDLRGAPLRPRREKRAPAVPI